MHISRLTVLTCTFLILLGLAACGGSRGTCGAQVVPVGPIPAGTPIPVQPLPSNSGLSTNATVGVDFTVNLSGAVTAASVRTSSGSTVVDNTALQIVKTTLFKVIDTNCEGQPVRSGFVAITFSPNP